MAASDKTLGKLHAKLAAVLNEALDGTDETTEVTDTDDEVSVHVVHRPASPAILAVVAKFLKDNSISADIENDGALQELSDKLKSRGRITGRDADEALASIAKGMLQ